MMLWLKSLPQSLSKTKFYIFEFILIFVAVAAGAWVENLREDFQNKDKERELVRSLIEDLQNDISGIREQIKLLKIHGNGMDSITTLLYSQDIRKQNPTLLQRLQLGYVKPLPLQGNNDRTKIQIESGGHEIISNKSVVTSMLNYWAIQKEISFNNNRYQDYWWESRKLAYQLFDSRYVKRVNGQLIVSLDAKLLSDDDKLLAQYGNWVNNMSGLIEFIYIPNLERQSMAATELVILIQQEYGLKP